MSTYIEISVFYDLIIENLDERDLNNFFFKMNTKTEHDKIDLFEREDKWNYRNKRNEKRISKRCKRESKKDYHVNKHDCWQWKR